MNQEYIVWIILALVVGYLIFTGVRSFKSPKAGKCSGCCGCNAKDEIAMAVKQKKS